METSSTTRLLVSFVTTMVRDMSQTHARSLQMQTLYLTTSSTQATQRVTHSMEQVLHSSLSLTDSPLLLSITFISTRAVTLLQQTHSSDNMLPARVWCLRSMQEHGLTTTSSVSTGDRSSESTTSRLCSVMSTTVLTAMTSGQARATSSLLTTRSSQVPL